MRPIQSTMTCVTSQPASIMFPFPSAMVTSNVINRQQALHRQSESYKKENCNLLTVSMSKTDMQHELEINTLGFFYLKSFITME